MSSRTCQLCGKPLSRIWVGAGGDFCSREHRNQYRLRRGMDRLLEANKVASLMRRRENPKPIRGAAAASVSATAQRGFWEAQRAPLPDEPRMLWRPSIARAPLASPAGRGPGQIKSASARVSSAAAQPRLASYARVTARAAALAVPSSRSRMGVKMPPASVALLRYHVLGASQNRREFGLLLRSRLEALLGRGGARAVETAGLINLQKTRRPRVLRGLANEGQALRVSGGAGFRIARPGAGRMTLTARLAARLSWRERTHPTSRSVSGRDAVAREAALPVASFGMWCPTGPSQAAAAGIRWPGMLPPSPGNPWNTALMAPRGARVMWSRARAGANGFANRVAPARAGLKVRCEARRLMPASAAGVTLAPQATSVPFEQRDSVFGYQPIQIDGTLAGTLGCAPASEAAAASRIEERFDAGWTNWVGGVEDWKLDAAGVRTGSLALFGPSLDLEDYELEFLARMENRSVTWVFRASNFSEYYAATIAVGTDGRFQFSRRAVIDGVEEAAETVPVDLGPKAKATLTVRTRATGGSFEVFVNGKPVAAWTDERLPIGGVGFMGAADDRARLYWVRVNSAESAGKE